MFIKTRDKSIAEKLIVAALTTSAIIFGFMLIAILLFMLQESWAVWSEISVWSFLSGTDWRPVAAVPQLGIAAMIASTLWVAGGSLLIAAPLGFGSAVFLAEFAPFWLAAVLRPVLNILTGIPSVVYGFLGAAVLVRYFESSFDLATGESLFAASLVLAIMILPYIISNSESSLRSVPLEYRHAGLALGVSRPYMVWRILLPLAGKGMLGALVLALGRALGETMAVLMLAGNILLFPSSWFSQGEPLPALIALELGSATPGTLHYQGLFAAGFVLLLIVIAINILIHALQHKLKNEVSRF
ncbi:MAG: phosphate ABC transporter permease subunit PstC [Syntrophomonadaceae bacterium]|nr:phosphate ABC transporter permease subunit PstC [Syntrophomonadaceae bacterium]